jgi:SAM-dependent methyltransferase
LVARRVTVADDRSLAASEAPGSKVCLACGSDRCDDRWVCPDCGSRPDSIDGFTAFAPTLATDYEGFDQDFFGQLAALEPSSFWFRARNQLILWALSTYFPDARCILEIGTGTGYVLSGIREMLPDADLHGSEIFAAGLAFAARRVPTATLYQMDARHIPFRDHFDVIGAFDVLEHIEQDVAVLDEVARALRPGGGFIATVPQHPSLWSAQDDHALHVRRYAARDLRRKVEATGLRVLRMTSFVSLLLPLMLLSRARMRKEAPGAEIDVMGDLRQPRLVDAGLGAVMAIERQLIRAGASLPVGGSLLLVCQAPGTSEELP